jgi:hypothetical protein
MIGGWVECGVRVWTRPTVAEPKAWMAEATEMRSGPSGDVEDIATHSVSAVQVEKE